MGRKFVRLSVGGVRDEAEIRGHRRTYIGAMPGTIVRALRDAGTNNPVMMIDEIDKVGSDYRGDPQSALLEVLDPEQNNSFRDHYLDLPFDLSRVLFICTANQLGLDLEPPLRDRMEIITLSGYTEMEKLQIAKRYLVPEAARSQRAAARSRSRSATRRSATIINDYTREAGVRNLEREIGTIFRKVARKIAEDPKFRARVKPENIVDYLQKPRFYNEVKKRVASVGVATGLAYTPVGGDILFIETTSMPGTGKLTLTGQLGDVMKEIGARRGLVPALAFRRAGLTRRLLRQARSAHSRAGRRRAEGRPERRHRDRDVDRVAADQSSRSIAIWR